MLSPSSPWSARLFWRRPRLWKKAPPLAIAFLLVVAASIGYGAQKGTTKLYVSNSEGDTITVIDLATYRVIADIQVGEQVHGLCAPSDGRRLFTTIESENNLKVIDTTTDKVVDTIPQEINLIDLKKMAYAKKIPVGGIPRPYAVSKDGKRLYAALSDFHGFVIATIPDQKIVARVELPPAPPLACRLEPHTPTHGIELSPDGKELWVTSLADSGVYVYEIATNHLSTEIHIGKCPNWITFSPDGRYGAVSNSGSDDSSIIDTRTRREVARVKVGKGPKRLLAVTVP
jgi:YVTN family beta-propeller protein